MNCRSIVESLSVSKKIDGYLSVKHGFLPPSLPLKQLSEKYSVWDEFAAMIPELYFSNQTQKILNEMPLLSIDDLTDEELPRASLVLSLLAHAYWRHGSDRAFSVRMSSADAYLPESIEKPWKEITERLGRGSRPFQGFYDLFINNFEIISRVGDQGEYSLDEITIENTNVLVKSFGNQAERVFYMAFVEMHALASPLVGIVLEIEDAIEQNNPESPLRIVDALRRIEEILKKCVRALKKISPMVSHKTFCDPVLWSKTVAIFAVSPTSTVQGGTSGAFAPLALTLDALLNRRKYESEYGQYVTNEKKLLMPAHIIEFVKATSRIDLMGFIKNQHSSPEIYANLADAYNRTIEAYAGPEGFLGRHISKVFNYLGVSTMVGRNQSTSGHERFVHEKTWVHVSKSLNVSRLERPQKEIACEAPADEDKTVEIPENLPVYSRLDLAKHHRPDDYWVAIDGYVYDLTDFLDKHPGGSEIMLAYASQDVSSLFHSIPEHSKSHIIKMKSRYLIGQFVENTCSDQGFISWNYLLEKLIFIRSIIFVQYNHVVDKKLKALFSGHTHKNFIHEHMAQIVGAIESVQGNFDPDEVWKQLKKHEFITNQDLRGEFSKEQTAHFDSAAHLFEKEDLQLVDSLIGFVLEVLEDEAYENKRKMKSFINLINRWLVDHLDTIRLIERQEETLFGKTAVLRVIGQTTATGNETHAAAPPYQPALDGVCILLVEDNAFNQQVTSEFLKDAGARVSIAAHGQEALDLMRRERFDCVLMDAQMPVMDGLEATRRMRADPALADIQVIAMTANTSNEDRQRCLAAGMDYFITKPISPEELYRALAKHVTPRQETASISITASADTLPAETAANPASLASDPQVIDLGVLAKVFKNNPEKVRKSAFQFLESVQQSIAEVNAALAREDFPLLTALGHRNKSSASSVGALGLAQLWQALEQLQENGNVEQAREIVCQLQPLLAQIEAHIAASFDHRDGPITGCSFLRTAFNKTS